MSKKEEIWVLGNDVEGADKCIGWDLNNVTNFSDFDKIIIDMTTITDAHLYFVTWERGSEIFEQIKNRLVNGGETVCILDYKTFPKNQDKIIIDNYFWSPISFGLRQVTTGIKFKKLENFEFQDYLELVDTWDIQFEPDFQEKTGLNSFSNKMVRPTELIFNFGGDVLGGVFRLDSSMMRHFSGKITFLPKVTDSKEGIYSILKTWGRTKTITAPPDWTKNIQLPGLEDVVKEISNENEKIKKIKINISKLEAKKVELERFRSLLYADSFELEDVVKESLSIIGISSIKSGRDENHEDLVFDLKSDNFDTCVVEVKGLEGNMKLAHIRQALHWALDYHGMGKKPKPLLIANIHRLEDVSTSRNERESFTNFEGFCKQYDICILPTTILFELIRSKLEGKNINLKKLVKILIETRGTITDISSVF